MTTLRLKLHIAGFNQVRNDPKILADLMARGERVAAAAGGGEDFVVKDGSTKSRARVVVITATPVAMELEATQRTLTNALDAAR